MSWLDAQRRLGDISTIFEVAAVVVMLAIVVYFIVT